MGAKISYRSSNAQMERVYIITNKNPELKKVKVLGRAKRVTPVSQAEKWLQKDEDQPGFEIRHFPGKDIPEEEIQPDRDEKSDDEGIQDGENEESEKIDGIHCENPVFKGCEDVNSEDENVTMEIEQPVNCSGQTKCCEDVNSEDENVTMEIEQPVNSSGQTKHIEMEEERPARLDESASLKKGRSKWSDEEKLEIQKHLLPIVTKN